MEQLLLDCEVEFREEIQYQNIEKQAFINKKAYQYLKDRPEDQVTREYRMYFRNEKRVWWLKDANLVELCEFPDTTNNVEIPEVQAFVEQGLIHENDHLTQQEKAILNEGVKGKGRMLVFHEKSKLDYKKPAHLREENIMKWLRVTFKEANMLSVSWEKLGLNRTTVYKMVFGYQSPTGWKPGLRKTRKTYIKYFAELIETLENPPEPQPEDHSEIGQIDSAIAKELQEWIYQKGLKLKDIEEQIEDEDEEETITIDDTGFGVHPLYYSNEGCPEEYLSMVMEATVEKIKTIKSEMFPVQTFYGFRRGKYGWLKPMQKTQMWSAIKDREKKLAKMIYRKVSGTAKIAIKDMMKAETRKDKALAWDLLEHSEIDKKNMEEIRWLMRYISKTR